MFHLEIKKSKLVCAALSCVLTAFLQLDAVAAMRPTPDYLKRAVVYQIVLRTFTRDGNFRGATAMLDHVRAAGVDVAYVAPFVEMDCDMDRSGWSPRQKLSGFGSPKNMYRISNYDKIDPEYGGDADFKAFNDKAHALGMKVFMDLVYLHCGPNNVLKDMFPDAFQRNADGSVRTTRWHFPYVNFESKDVRKYLIDSMRHWMRLGCDGFRCDVGDEVPLDFWVEAVTACQKINPELVMINEGRKAEWLEKAFDACYDWPWSFTLRGYLTPGCLGSHEVKKSLSDALDRMIAYEAKMPKGALMFCFMDNHDTASDDWDKHGGKRFDRVHPVEAGNAAFVLTFLRPGLPLVFNGNEIADNARNSFFAPVEHPSRCGAIVDWGRALQPDGQKRLALIRRLAKMRHEDPIWSEGDVTWVRDGEKAGVIAFVRTLGARRVLVAANLRGAAKSFRPSVAGVGLKSARLLEHEASVAPDGSLALGPWGYVAIEIGQ